MKIRPLLKADQEIFYEMITKFYSSDATMTEMSLENREVIFAEALKENPYFKVYLIEEDLIEKSQVVGYFLLSYTWYTEFAGLIVIIDEIYLDEAARGKNLGSQVFAWIKSEYEQKPEFKAIRLEYSQSNDAAVRLYTRLGYKDWNYGQMMLNI